MAKLDSQRVKQDAHGKWPSILQALGVDASCLVNRSGPCPMCQDGRTRFRFDDQGDGRWFCHHCPKKSGDGFALLMGVKGWAFPEALEEVAKVVGIARPVKIRQGPPLEEVRAEMKRMWASALPIHMVDEVADWWRVRLGYVPDLADVKATPALRCPGAGVYPAMLARVAAPDGLSATIHRTFLGPGGVKANVDEPRRLMPYPMPKGSAVRLSTYTTELGIAEGIETAVAAMALFNVPCWAAVNAGNLEAWLPPEGVRVIILADNDVSFTGQAAAYSLAKRLRLNKIEAEVRLPPAPGMDWNDVWQARATNPDPEAKELAA